MPMTPRVVPPHLPRIRKRASPTGVSSEKQQRALTGSFSSLPSLFVSAVPISHSGAFVYFVEYDSPERPSDPATARARIQSAKGYFSVDPVLVLPRRSDILTKTYAPSPTGGLVQPTSNGAKSLLPLDGIVALSVIAKWQGHIDNWGPYLDEATKRGYNMLHFTPLQTRGQSGSPYSILDQLKFDPELFGGKGDGVTEIGAMIKTCREKYGLLSLTDVVLNHTADNSPWLEEHPESGQSSVPGRRPAHSNNPAAEH